MPSNPNVRRAVTPNEMDLRAPDNGHHPGIGAAAVRRLNFDGALRGARHAVEQAVDQAVGLLEEHEPHIAAGDLQAAVGELADAFQAAADRLRPTGG